MSDESNDSTTGAEKVVGMGTLYSLAMAVMKDYIRVYLKLSQETSAFAAITESHVQDLASRVVVLAGLNSPLDAASTPPKEVVEEWRRMRAVPFDVETAITKGVYTELRERTACLLDELEKQTLSFSHFDPQYIALNPEMLPVLQRLANIPSKAELKKRIGSVSDNSISGKAAQRLAELLNQRQPGRTVTRATLLQSIEPTLEGIVRDLVGRVLLESIVADALDSRKLPYKREAEYRYIEGVVYNFRADFVLPDEKNPKAFIEVRKSSTRHASLYAKDKMFSAINWKGKNKEMLGILVVEGPWTGETLLVLTRVFDYVVPMSSVSDVAEAVAAYIDGDKSKLKWLIDFDIRPAAEK